MRPCCNAAMHEGGAYDVRYALRSRHAATASAFRASPWAALRRLPPGARANTPSRGARGPATESAARPQRRVAWPMSCRPPPNTLHCRKKPADMLRHDTTTQSNIAQVCTQRPSTDNLSHNTHTHMHAGIIANAGGEELKSVLRPHPPKMEGGLPYTRDRHFCDPGTVGVHHPPQTSPTPTLDFRSITWPLTLATQTLWSRHDGTGGHRRNMDADVWLAGCIWSCKWLRRQCERGHAEVWHAVLQCQTPERTRPCDPPTNARIPTSRLMCANLLNKQRLNAQPWFAHMSAVRHWRAATRSAPNNETCRTNERGRATPKGTAPKRHRARSHAR